MLTINEASFFGSDDWVEIYNSKDSDASLDLSKYRLRDSTSKNKKDLSGNLLPDGFYVVDFRNWLNNAGDTVRLLRVTPTDEELIDKITYGKDGICLPVPLETIGRYPDGSANIVKFAKETKGLSNVSSVVDCQKPQTTPTPTVLMTPTATVPIIVQTAYPIAPEVETPNIPQPTIVLGIQSTTSIPEVLEKATSASAQVGQTPITKSNILLVLFIGTFLICLAIFLKSNLSDILNKFGKNN